MKKRFGELLNKPSTSLSKNLHKITNNLKESDLDETPFSKSTPIGENFTSEKSNKKPKEGNPVVYQENGKVLLSEFKLEPAEKSTTFFEGGYHQKSLKLFGESSVKNSTFTTNGLTSSKKRKILGIQLIQTSSLDKVTDINSWEAKLIVGGAKDRIIGHSLEAVGQGFNYFTNTKKKEFNITSFQDYSGEVAGAVRVITSQFHRYNTGDYVRHVDGSDGDYDGVYKITVIDASSYYIMETWTSTETAKVFRISGGYGNIVSGNIYIEITLLDSSGIPIDANVVGSIEGFIHYIEMPDLELNS